MNITIRASQSSDMTAITAIYAHAVLNGTASWELEPPDETEMAQRRAAILASGYPHIIALRDGLVLGYAYASAFRPRIGYRATVEDSIYIAPEAQGQGVGKLLLRHIIDICTEAGFRQMVAVLGDGFGQSPASRRLHEAMGFQHAGVLTSVGFKQGRWLDMVLMQLVLGDGDTSISPFAVKATLE